MSDISNNGPTHEERLRARIVAWVLGEASAFEAEELEDLCEADAELRAFADEMREIHGLIGEAATTAADPAWRLSGERRRALEPMLGEDIALEKRVAFSRQRAITMIAACVVATVVAVFLMGPGASDSPVAERASVETIGLVSSEPRSTVPAPAAEPVDRAELKRQVREQEEKVEERRHVFSTIVRTRRQVSKDDTREEAIGRGLDAAAYVDAKRQLEQDQARLQELKVRLIGEEIASRADDPAKPDPSMATLTAARPAAPSSAPFPESADRLAGAEGQALSRAREVFVDGGAASDEARYLSAYQLSATEPQREVVPAEGESAAFARNSIDAILNNPDRRRDLMRKDGAVLSEEMAEDPELQQPDSAAVTEIHAAEEPFSTFSLNVGDTSFRVASFAIASGGRPEPAEVKVEQFYNAMDYMDPAPAAGEPIAATIKQSADPVLPGRQLLRIGLRTGSAGRAASQPLRLTLLVDQSGSMGRDDRREALADAIGGLVTLLTPADRVTVMGFARTPRLLAEGMSGADAGKLPGVVTATATEGGTNFEEALKLARELALRHMVEGAQNRIILFTDGAANLGDADPNRLSGQIAELRQQGLAFDIAGMAPDELSGRLLEEMARHGNGRYLVVNADEAGDFARRVAGAFRPAAENVKVQVKFNPARVGAYRLVGFEADRLREEDFHNDSVDAAELAPDGSGVALYQIETLPDGVGEIGEVSVMFRDVASGEMVERSWMLGYDSAAPAFDLSSPGMQLAGLAMMAGEKLRGGTLAEAIDFSEFGKSKAEVRQAFAGSQRVRELLEMIEAID